MFPDGIGIMFWNGAQGLYYYAAKAGRIFVENSGVIISVAVGAYVFPQQTKVALAGAVVSRGATWLTEEIDQRYHRHLADAYDWLLDQAPQNVTQGYLRMTRTVGAPQREISTAVRNRGHQGPQILLWVNEDTVTELIAPVLEEGIFRLGIQSGIGIALTRFGVPSPLAHSLSGAIATTLFAGAHNPDPRDPQFRQTLISGIAFGLMMHFRGYPAAVMTHSFHNFSMRAQERLGY
ncbi:type II CAAX prenyl endopeptidase Rce1 family protein [Roseibium salinum]|uniref:CPBP family glutamic-type intramembrane protease n=1 Tax=Roseibium salinum TaxID=1604349 RepID=A0ABT3R213_9HYPH|nr:CPBP family glutamic-type intramembrane protease [Roseibium sp. DSM 29163]MCX2723270.1 CPBP family glutamic-type intramembrane protease [Roseibium sp. DSM 29163]